MPAVKIYALLFLLFSSCVSSTREKPGYTGPSGYDWNNPKKLKLSISLDEISGIGYDPATRSIIAINDEEGKLYAIPLPDTKPLRKSKFSKGADYEDLCFDGTRWYALKSNGSLFAIDSPFTENVQSTEYKLPVKGKNEFEAVIFDKHKHQLVLICKTCSGVNGITGGYRFDLTSKTFDTIPSFSINFDSIPDSVVNKTKTVLVSGAAVHPLTGEWYILASANGLLLITDESGKCKAAYKLDRKQFKQPEGICFTPDGGLYISNEARNGVANILFFPYRKNG